MTVLIRTGASKKENEASNRGPQQVARAIGDALGPTVLIEAPRLPASGRSDAYAVG
jgi:hypothetical protein